MASKAWRELTASMNESKHAPYFWSKGAVEAFKSITVGQPVSAPYTESTYFVVSNDYGMGRVFVTYRFDADGGEVHNLGTHAVESDALAAVKSLAGVA